MKKFLLLALVLLGVTSTASAQWRAGVTMGGMWNHYSIDNHYMND